MNVKDCLVTSTYDTGDLRFHVCFHNDILAAILDFLAVYMFSIAYYGIYPGAQYTVVACLPAGKSYTNPPTMTFYSVSHAGLISEV